MTIEDRRALVDSLQQAPFSRLLGLKIESSANGDAVVRMPFNLALLNDGGPKAPVHGGAIATLVARAKVRRKGKRIASLSVEIVDDSGALVADALITYKIA
jgi:acyl-coenzyme A thioesterase PaaI-like protein